MGLYREPIAARREEIASTLLANVENPAFDRVVAVVEDETWTAAGAHAWQPWRWSPAWRHVRTDVAERLNLVFLGERLTYQAAFAIAGAPKWAHGAVVLANSDIEFDHTVELANEVPERALWCVTRTEKNGEFPWNPAFTQDAWIFRPPLLRFWCPFKLGVPGCDNRIAFEAKRSGLAVSNPARRIRALHHHTSAVRRVNSEYRGPSLGVPLDPPDQRT